MIIEYHHKIGGHASCLSKFLGLLEQAGFEYQISAHCEQIMAEDVFQDVLIGAYRKLYPHPVLDIYPNNFSNPFSSRIGTLRLWALSSFDPASSPATT